MRIIDTRGQQCPAPLVATKRALRETEKEGSFKVFTDNKTSLNNISRFLRDNNTEYIVNEEDGGWALIISGDSVNTSPANAEDYCTHEIPHFTRGDFIVAFTSDKMGEGDDKLGHLLLTNFIKAIKDLETLPVKMVFYNNGVRLGTVDSPVFEYLKEIERMGVGLLFCATCAKFYSLEEKIQIGTLSNMFEIAQVMSSAGNIVKP